MRRGRELEGKVCLVTGASRGLGRAIAECFAMEGATVYAAARTEGSVEAWATELIDREGVKIIPVYFDVADMVSDREIVTRIKREQGRLDVLVNNAGVTKVEPIGMIREETIRKLFETNVYGPIELLQFSARVMQRQTSGSIINISSIIGVEGDRGELVYSATKGAVISMTKSAAKELAPYHIRVNSVAPGFADTDMFRTAAGSEEKIEKYVENIGFKRLAVPEDIANACLFFASDQSFYITGQILGVNGSTRI